MQSLIAVGSGGFTGVGLMESKQKLFYLPEAHTDFIFAVLCEELGFIGGAIVLSLFVIYGWRGIRSAFKTTDDFGRLAALVSGTGIHSDAPRQQHSASGAGIRDRHRTPALDRRQPSVAQFLQLHTPPGYRSSGSAGNAVGRLVSRSSAGQVVAAAGSPPCLIHTTVGSAKCGQIDPSMLNRLTKDPACVDLPHRWSCSNVGKGACHSG